MDPREPSTIFIGEDSRKFSDNYRPVRLSSSDMPPELTFDTTRSGRCASPPNVFTTTKLGVDAVMSTEAMTPETKSEERRAKEHDI